MYLDRDHSPGLDRFAKQATHNPTDVSLETWGLAKDASATQEAATGSEARSQHHPASGCRAVAFQNGVKHGFSYKSAPTGIHRFGTTSS